MAIVVHSANIQDRDGAKLVLGKLAGRYPRLQLIWADGAYAGQLIDWTRAFGGWLLEIVRRPPDSHQFEVLPRSVGRRTHFGLAGPVSPAEQGL